jgi:hypothetical protein
MSSRLSSIVSPSSSSPDASSTSSAAPSPSSSVPSSSSRSSRSEISYASSGFPACCKPDRPNTICPHPPGYPEDFTCPPGPSQYANYWTCCSGNRIYMCGECTDYARDCFHGDVSCSIWWATSTPCGPPSSSLSSGPSMSSVGSATSSPSSLSSPSSANPSASPWPSMSSIDAE